MTGYDAILRLCGAFADGDRINYLALLRRFIASILAFSELPFASQMTAQLLFEDSARLNIDRLIDRLVRYSHRFVVWVGHRQFTCNLLGRPVQNKLANHMMA